MKIDELNAIKDKMKNQVTLRAEDPDSTKVLVARVHAVPLPGCKRCS